MAYLMRRLIVVVGVCGLLTFWPFSVAYAASLTGMVHTVHVNLETRMIHVFLDGQPEFDGGTCQSYWTGNSLDDSEFYMTIFPLLIAARDKSSDVTIYVTGCTGIFPKIVGIDYPPR